MNPAHHARRRRRTLPSFLICAALTGCAARPAVPPIVGTWRGPVPTGGVSLPSRWELRADGTQSETLTLPQGELTSEGTFTFHGGTLTARTTGRTVTLGGQKKTMPLVSPLEAVYRCQVSGDTLTLTRPQAHEAITLTRENP